MYVCTTWKARQLTIEQSERMMAIWGKMEAEEAEQPAAERVCWFITADGTAGFTVSKVHDPDAAMALGLETSLALSEFLEFESRPVLDLEGAMGAIVAGIERAKG